jgi:tRNA(adenine34) deaminase
MNEFMQTAIEQAQKVYDDIPVGAVIVKDGKVIASAFNTKEGDNDITSHAEILALRKASSVLNNWRLEDCDLYVTLEPCPMCAGAIAQSRIKKIYIGTKSNIKNNYNIIHSILQNKESDHFVEVEYLNNLDCSKILSYFFGNKR